MIRRRAFDSASASDSMKVPFPRKARASHGKSGGPKSHGGFRHLFVVFFEVFLLSFFLAATFLDDLRFAPAFMFDS